jgi:60 kDa SS-A/Ro ribonucleoprotein
MALLRNLRTFVEKGVDHDVINTVADKISDPEQVARSKQFPFRFYSAMNALDGADAKDKFDLETLRDAVRNALELSATNVPRFPGRSVIFIDVSGSMDHKISGYSSVTAKDIAMLYGAIFNKIAANAIIGVFADRFSLVRGVSKDILATKEKIDSVNVGGSTNAYLAFEWLLKDRVEADRVFLLSDMQHWDTRGGAGMIAAPYLNWKRSVSPNARLYSVDLVGYGTSSFPQGAPGVATIAGWSERIFDFARCFEMDRPTMLKAIESVKLV